MMHSYLRQLNFMAARSSVLILVLMDDALVQVEKEAAERGDEVLILVLMDDALVR